MACRLEELAPGGRLVVFLGGRSIGLLRTQAGVYAVRNACPHQGAELCRGTLGGTMLPSDAHEYVFGMNECVLRCPWHGWEFDLRTGRSLFDPEGVRVRTYPVAVQDGLIMIKMGSGRAE